MPVKEERSARRRRMLALALLVVCGYFTLESFLPPAAQPSARVGLAAIRAYQAWGSPRVAAAGVSCRYTPTCSHYAAAALAHYGTMEGVVRTAGRLWRCSPWGGAGYDPAVASTRRIALQQETPEQKAAREELERKLEEDRRRTLEELNKAGREMRKAFEEGAPEAALACTAACLIPLIFSAIMFVVWIVLLVYIVKDAKARGDPNAVLWIVLVVLLPLVGAVVYFVARPKGNLAPCANCKNPRLETLVKCPHCGADAAGGVKA